jgi:hypothetical protein
MEDTPITWHDVVTGLAEWRQQHPQATFREIEAALDERLVRLRAQLLQETVLASTATDLSCPPSAPPTCPHCQLPLTARGQHTRHVVTQEGRDVALTRTYGTARVAGAGFSPLDEQLALPAGTLSPQLHEWLVCLATLATWMPFASRPGAERLHARGGE